MAPKEANPGAAAVLNLPAARSQLETSPPPPLSLLALRARAHRRLARLSRPASSPCPQAANHLVCPLDLASQCPQAVDRLECLSVLGVCPCHQADSGATVTVTDPACRLVPAPCQHRRAPLRLSANSRREAPSTPFPASRRALEACQCRLVALGVMAMVTAMEALALRLAPACQRLRAALSRPKASPLQLHLAVSATATAITVALRLRSERTSHPICPFPAAALHQERSPAAVPHFPRAASAASQAWELLQAKFLAQFLPSLPLSLLVLTT